MFFFHLITHCSLFVCVYVESCTIAHSSPSTLHIERWSERENMKMSHRRLCVPSDTRLWPTIWLRIFVWMGMSHNWLSTGEPLLARLSCWRDVCETRVCARFIGVAPAKIVVVLYVHVLWVASRAPLRELFFLFFLVPETWDGCGWIDEERKCLSDCSIFDSIWDNDSCYIWINFSGMQILTGWWEN